MGAVLGLCSAAQVNKIQFIWQHMLSKDNFLCLRHVNKANSMWEKNQYAVIE